MPIRIPFIVTSSDARLVARVQQDHERNGGDSTVAKPPDNNVLLGAIRAQIGPA